MIPFPTPFPFHFPLISICQCVLFVFTSNCPPVLFNSCGLLGVTLFTHFLFFFLIFTEKRVEILFQTFHSISHQSVVFFSSLFLSLFVELLLMVGVPSPKENLICSAINLIWLGFCLLSFSGSQNWLDNPEAEKKWGRHWCKV